MSSSSHMKKQKYIIFVNKSLKINILKIKNTIKFKIIVIMQVKLQILHIVYLILKKGYLKKLP